MWCAPSGGHTPFKKIFRTKCQLSELTTSSSQTEIGARAEERPGSVGRHEELHQHVRGPPQRRQAGALVLLHLLLVRRRRSTSARREVDDGIPLRVHRLGVLRRAVVVVVVVGVRRAHPRDDAPGFPRAHPGRREARGRRPSAHARVGRPHRQPRGPRRLSRTSHRRLHRVAQTERVDRELEHEREAPAAEPGHLPMARRGRQPPRHRGRGVPGDRAAHPREGARRGG